MNTTVHTHPNPSPLLQKALNRSLPYSINLAYRTQHANKTDHAHILATFAPNADVVPDCWAAAYFDRSMRPETELWIFAAGEDPNHHCYFDHEATNGGEEEGKKKKLCAKCKKAVFQLLDHMVKLPIPPLHPTNEYAMDLARQHEIEHPEPGPDGRYAIDVKTYMRHMLLPNVIKLGCVHEKVKIACEAAGLVRREFPGPHEDLTKFLFKVTDLPETKALLEGLRWGEVRERDLDVVKARTSIPRTTRTLMSLKSLCVFDEKTDRPVAWAFLGLDGSLTTLHTEEGYRGKGIAKNVAATLFRKYAPGLAVDEQGTAWAHADVYVGNEQSMSVCRSLGGNGMWTCFWVAVDLDKAGSLASRV